MTLVDTADGVAMLGAYGWAFIAPSRKLVYNIVLTSISVVVARLIGGLEVMQVLGAQALTKGS